MFSTPLGALAQLGEHLLCKQGVIGSIPIGSTSFTGAAEPAQNSPGDCFEVKLPSDSDGVAVDRV